MFIEVISYGCGKPRILYHPEPRERYIIVPDDTPTEPAPHGEKPKYIATKVLLDAGMKTIDGEYVEFVKPDGTTIAEGEHYVLPSAS